MTKNAVPDGKREVEPMPVPLQIINDAQALLIVAKTGERLGQRGLSGMPERGVTEVMSKPDRLDKVLVKVERSADGAGNLHHLESVREASAVVVSSGRDKDLGFVHQATKTLGVEDAVAVALKCGSQIGLRVRSGSQSAATRGAGWSEKQLFLLFQ